MTIGEILGLILGISSLVLTWYFGTRKKRLLDKIEQHEKELSKLKDFSSSTGYKRMLNHCFLSFSYVGFIVLFYFGLQHFPIKLNFSGDILLLINGFTSGILIGCGLVLLELFLFLRKVKSSSDSIKSLKKRINKLSELKG